MESMAEYYSAELSQKVKRGIAMSEMKVIFNLKGGQKNELLLNLIFPDYPDGNDGENENGAKEKETDNSVSNSEGCAYTPEMVEVTGLAPVYQRKTT